jgi:hypothetical protein
MRCNLQDYKISFENKTTIFSAAFIVSAFLLTGVANSQAVEQEKNQNAVVGSFPDGIIEELRPQRTDSSSLTTRFSLNGTVFDAGSLASGTLGFQSGEKRNTLPTGEISVPFKVDIESSVIDGVGVRRQLGWYAQLKSFKRESTVQWERETPVTLLGYNLDLTVTGNCVIPNAGTDASDLCTYTPGISVADTDIDTETLVPNSFRFDADFGSTISQSTSDALRLPGFQRGVADEPVGISLRIPNSGDVVDPSRMRQVSADRTESGVNRPILTLSRVDQTVRSSDTRASLDRTVRGLVFLEPKEWDSYTFAAQLAAFVLPKWNGKINSDEGSHPRNDISNNLFFASNNLRLPKDSLTMFQTGAGYVKHSSVPVRFAKETPTAFYNSFWLGVSPVRTVRQTVSTALTRVGKRTVISGNYKEGGTFGSLEDVTGQISIIDILANEIDSFNIGEIVDVYVQAGLEVTEQPAISKTIQTQVSTFAYVPHLSLSGNRTNGNSVLRYYAGALDPSDSNFYFGADYSYVSDNGVKLSVGAVNYSNPNYDYYSMAEADVSRSFAVGKGDVLAVGLSGKVEFDRPSLIPSLAAVSNGSDRIEMHGSYKADWGALIARAKASGIRKGPLERSVSVGATFPLSDQTQISIQITPYSELDAYVVAGVGLKIPLTSISGSPVFQGQFAKVKYNLGDDAFGQGQSVTENTFQASFQYHF